MSAYVVEDMTELSQAHATYRFIVCDEEEEKPRLLVCHFFFQAVDGGSLTVVVALALQT